MKQLKAGSSSLKAGLGGRYSHITRKDSVVDTVTETAARNGLLRDLKYALMSYGLFYLGLVCFFINVVILLSARMFVFSLVFQGLL